MTKKKSKGCCEDKLQFLQLKREHNQLNNIDFKFNLDATHLHPNSFNQQFLITYSQDNEKNLIAHRPAIHKQRLHLLYRVLLI